MNAVQAMNHMKQNEGVVMSHEPPRKDMRHKLFRFWNGNPEARLAKHTHWHVGFALTPDEVTAEWHEISE